ncbi:hypothetical protein BDY24DRAFT_387433 [Mrakia frigida]|uniref:Ska1p n=1 Tax=Mrakia frigida TaxID=29902 RepID=UPI003FCC06CD
MPSFSQSLDSSPSFDETKSSTTFSSHEAVEAPSSDPISLPSSSPCSTPRPSLDHSQHSDELEDQKPDLSVQSGVVVGQKRKRAEGREEAEDEDEDEEGGSVEKSKANEPNKSTTSSKVEKKRTKSWSGDLEDKMTPFDILSGAANPIQDFEKAQKGFMEGIMTEFHLVLLELTVWSQHRLSSLQKASTAKIHQSIEEIRREERKQGSSRRASFSFPLSVEPQPDRAHWLGWLTDLSNHGWVAT